MPQHLRGKAHVRSILHHLLKQSLTRYRCGNVGKLTRIAEAIADPSFTAKYPRKNPSAPFLVLGGFADFLLPSAAVEGHGAIIGLANLSPVMVFCIRPGAEHV